jgi:PAS domain S-box-containing protein
MDFNGKEWSLRFTRSRDQFSYFSGKVMIVLSSGIIISFLLFFLYLSFLVARNRMRTAEQLSLEVRESEKKFRTLSTQFEAILDHIPGHVFYKDKSNNFIRVNRFMADEHGKSKDELEGKNLADFYPEADAAKYYEDDLLVFNSGAPRLNIEENWVTPKGVKWVNSSKIPFVDDSGKTIGIIGISMDITEKKKYEQTLRETNDYLENLINYANAPIIVWDTQFRITRFNHAFEFITGRTEEEVLGLSVEILFPPSLADKSMGQLRKTVTGERWETEEIEILHLDKSVRTILWNSATLFTRDGHEPIATIAQGQDITERKKSEASLLKAKKEAETANKSKSIFLANMSHEIRTPLNAIIGFSQLISRDKLLTATQKEYNLSIIRSGEHLLSLINDILELSKVEAGRIVLNLTNINLHIFLYEIQTVFKDRAQSKRLQFILETASDLPQYVVVDESKLRRIFVNLIENAIKFTDEGGIAVRVRADMARDGAGKLIVEVQDSGQGISLSEQTNLFKQFVQTSTGIKKGSGTGLGLVLSRELARLMGGEINLTSEVGRGSVFSFNIEIKPGKAESVSTNVPRRVICIDKKETIYRILVVDDKEENLRVVVDLLRMVGFETNEAVNGADAITKFETWNPHLILMDLRMPLMDGYEAANLIKSTEAGKRTPIIALTASAFEEIHVKEKMPWLQGYIRKPFRENELFSTIGSILGINYNYENDTPVAQTKYLNKHELLVSEIEKLPEKLVSQLTDALAVADINQMIKLINRIESDNPELAQYLLTLVADYNYDYLLRIFNRKETTL